MDSNFFDKLDDAIICCKFFSLTGDAQVIIMHPNTFKILHNAFCNSLQNFDNVMPKTYRGIKILRSSDLEPGNFEVY